MLDSETHCLQFCRQHTDANIRLLARVIDRDLGNSGDPFLDGIGDVRHHLDSLAEIIATTFTLNDGLVNFTSCNVVVACQLDSEVSKIECCLVN